MTITILLSDKQDKVTAIALAVATLVSKSVSERESNKTDAQYTNDLLDQIADEVSEMGLGEFATERLIDIINPFKEYDVEDIDEDPVYDSHDAEKMATMAEMEDTIDNQASLIKELNGAIQTLQYNHNNELRYLKDRVIDIFRPLNTDDAIRLNAVFARRKWEPTITGDDIEEARRISLANTVNNHNNTLLELETAIRNTPMPTINRTLLLRIVRDNKWDLPK